MFINDIICYYNVRLRSLYILILIYSNLCSNGFDLQWFCVPLNAY